MAIVYLEQQQSLKKAVAIKVLNASMVSDASVQQQFKQESLMVVSILLCNMLRVFPLRQ
jgi:serine/threonine protein kinase